MYTLNETIEIVNNLKPTIIPTIAKYRHNKHKKLYDSIMYHYNWLIVTKNFQAAVWCIKNNIQTQPTCKCCNREVDFYQPSKGGFRIYCSAKCRANDNEWQLQSQSTFAMNHNGYNTWSQIPDNKEKISIQAKININNISHATRMKASQQAQATIKKRYGCNTGWLPHAINTRIRNGTMIHPSLHSDYTVYKRKCLYYTELHDLTILDNYEKRGNHAVNKNAYHLDHIVSCYDGFQNNIPPWIIGSIHNLKFIPYLENLSKQKRSNMAIDELYDLFYLNFSSSSWDNFSKLARDKLPRSYKFFKEN